MRLQEEATELEKKVVSLIEELQITSEERKASVKEHLIREYDYLRLVKKFFPELRLPQYDEIKDYMKKNYEE